MNKKQETIRTYVRSAAALSDKYDSMEGYLPDIRRVFSLAGKADPKVVEIGCGSGRDARDLFGFTSDYLGFDVSSQMVKRASATVPGAKFIVADADHFAFPEKIDAVFAFASLLHSDKESLAKILDRIHTALAEKGLIFMSLKCGDYAEDTRTDKFGTRTFYYYTPEIIEKLAGEKFKTAFKERRIRNGQEWFGIILQKS